MRRIAVFAKHPMPGQVKTRLSPALPAELACELYRAMLDDALAAAAGCGADERWVYWASEQADRAGEPRGFQARTQQGADLGERLAGAFAEWVNRDADRAVIIGADCPDLDASAIDQAFAALDNADLVIGPTRDGGYYLIGLSRTAPSLFNTIPWSTPNVLEQTLERARRASLTVETLLTLEDIDTPEDLIRWIAREATGPTRAHSHTVAALIRMGLLTATHA